MFKKSLAVLVVIFGLFSVSVAQAADAESFLLQNYGWTFDTSKFPGLKCAPKQVLPGLEVKKGDGNNGAGMICSLKERTWTLTIYWRVPEFLQKAAEETVYWNISNKDPWSVRWYEDKYPLSDSGVVAVVKDSILTVKNVETKWGKKTLLSPVSFCHFSVPMPNGRSFVNTEGKNEVNLAFTIDLQGGFKEESGVYEDGRDDFWVKKTIREIADSIRMTETK